MRAEDYFSIIPEYVLDAEISDGAYRLYGALAREVNTGTKVGFARLRDVAKRLRKSESSVRRHLDELVKAGLLLSQPQWTNDQGQFSLKNNPGWRQTMNMYTLKRVYPPSKSDRGTHSPVTDVVKSPEPKSPISVTSSLRDDTQKDHSRSEQVQNATNPGNLSGEQRRQLRQALQAVGKKISQGQSFWDDEPQELWWTFLGLMEDILPDIYDNIEDALVNGKWTVGAKVAEPYQAGIELNKIIHTGNM